MFSFSRRSKVFWAFVWLAIGLLVVFSVIFYFESNRNWENQKLKGLSNLIADIENVSQAREFFDDIRVISPNGNILENQGIFTELPEDILGENRRLAYQGLSLFVISKSLADGTKILFVDDITDAVESKNLMFENLLTSTFILGFFVIVIGWLFTQKIFSPIRKIVEAIEHFRLEQDPSEDAILLSGKQSDEFVRIARNLESLFARIRVETSKIEDLSSNIAHELKNSLFGIASTLELALLQQHPKQKIEQALGQVIHLWSVVQALLLLANKEMNLEKYPTSLLPLVSHFGAEDPRISIHGSQKIQWEIHKDLFEVALGNIIGNAKKFTPENGKIDIQVLEDMIVISDTGCGISADELPLIFDRFYKVDSMRSNGSGTGLWLTLAKHILEKLHGFSLKITSTIGTGTQVKICRMPAP